MHADAYMATMDLERDRLVVTPSNAASRVALLGQSGGAGQERLELALGEVSLVEVKGASMMTNGRVTLHSAGSKYLVHFRRKHEEGVRALVDALVAAGVPGA